MTARPSRFDEYVIVHVGKIVGGFAKRFSMFVSALGKRRPTSVKTPATAFCHLVAQRIRGQNTCVIVYYDVLAPFVALVKLLFPRLTLVYMVRGDHVSWASFHRRRLRAAVAEILQKWMSKLGCIFVFASEDLRDTFTERLGPIDHSAVLPNTLGRPLPPSRPFDGRVAVVGDFGTVKNIEFVLNSLREGHYHVDLFGCTSTPEEWNLLWLERHGVVADLRAHLKHCSLVVLSSVTEGFPNVAVEALEAGCGIVAPNGSPFRKFPLNSMWRYHMETASGDATGGCNNGLKHVLCRLAAEQPDFRANNRELYELIESDWETRIWEIFQ